MYDKAEFGQVVLSVGPYAIRDHVVVSMDQEIAEVHDLRQSGKSLGDL